MANLISKSLQNTILKHEIGMIAIFPSPGSELDKALLEHHIKGIIPFIDPILNKIG